MLTTQPRGSWGNFRLKLQRAGVTEEWATHQAKIYRRVASENKHNPTATLRADWLEKVAARLRRGS